MMLSFGTMENSNLQNCYCVMQVLFQCRLVLAHIVYLQTAYNAVHGATTHALIDSAVANAIVRNIYDPASIRGSDAPDVLFTWGYCNNITDT